MAFFKFRFPGKTSSAAADGVAPASAESLEVLRRRARHRLLGSVVLVFVAVVAFPLFFDSQPRPVPVDTPIVIPDRAQTPPLSTGARTPESHAPAAPLMPSAAVVAAGASEVPAHASLEPGKEEVLPVASAQAPAAAPPRSEKPPTANEHRGATPSASPEVKSAKDKPRAENDGQKAQSLLEGKAASSDAVRLVIQVGAFSDADKVREVRRKLEQAGLKTYVQSVEGKDGKRTIRVRVGPFESRADADKVAARIRKLELPASVISL